MAIQEPQKMRVKDMIVKPCSVKEIKEFIETWHYSKSIRGINHKYCFKLTYDGRLIGACIFGRPSTPDIWRKYAESPNEILELRRLCCIDDTPKNTESYFIGHCLRWLKKNTNIKTIVSYADPEFGHEGVIYKASNFEYLGMTKPERVVIWNGRRYHRRTINKCKGRLLEHAKRLREALEKGEAYYKKTPGKHIYKYDLIRKKSRK